MIRCGTRWSGTRMPMVRRFGCLQALGGFARGRQQEGERSGDVCLQQPELPVVQLCEAADFRQVAAHQREIVVFVGVAMRRMRSRASLSPTWQPSA